MDASMLAAKLRQEIKLLEKLLALAGEQRECLVQGNAEQLGEIISQQAELLQKLSKLTAKTNAAMKDNEQYPDCKPLRAEIKELAERVRSHGRVNAALSREAMRYIDFSMGLLSGRFESPFYSAQGKQHSQAYALMNKTA